LSINSSTGLISGTISPTAAGAYTVVVSATDANTSGTVTFTWAVADSNAPTLTSPGDQSNTVGDKVNVTVPIVDAER
jgi:hypothetical protein